MAQAIGIDLGTTNSVMAAIIDGDPVIIPNAEGEHLTPSIVAMDCCNNLLVGSAARRQAALNPHNTMASIKRKMGTGETVTLNGAHFSPQEISSMILAKIKKDAENRLGSEVDQAVITVPAYFNDRQRQATKEAGEIAGFDVLRIINEPTSASLAYGLDYEDNHTILIWDLGGGTFDVSILELGGGIFEVKAVNGNTRLGGDDWTQRLMDYIREEVRSTYEMDLSGDLCSLQRLRDMAERIKMELSEAESASVYFPFTGIGGRSENVSLTITRSLFEHLTLDLFKQMEAPTLQALEDAGLFPPDIDRVVLVGGATRMPMVRIMVENLFNRTPFCSINPDEAVALGAALQAGLLTGKLKKMTLIDVTPLSLGIETMGGICTKIIHRNTKIPTLRSQIFTTAEDNQTAVDIHILQGERPMAVDDMSIGKFSLQNIPPAPRGVPMMEVTFKIDVNGILHVSACDIHTEDKEVREISITEKLSKAGVQCAIREARFNQQKDRELQRKAELSILIRNVQEAVHVFLLENSSTLKADDLTELEGRLKTLKERDPDQVEKAAGDLKRMLAHLEGSVLERAHTLAV